MKRNIVNIITSKIMLFQIKSHATYTHLYKIINSIYTLSIHTWLATSDSDFMFDNDWWTERTMMTLAFAQDVISSTSRWFQCARYSNRNSQLSFNKLCRCLMIRHVLSARSYDDSWYLLWKADSVCALGILNGVYKSK